MSFWVPFFIMIRFIKINKSCYNTVNISVQWGMYVWNVYITLLSLGLCLALPMLSQASDINPVIHVTNVHNGQYDAALAAITDTKFYGPYQFRVLKNAIETQGETKDIDGRAF